MPNVLAGGIANAIKSAMASAKGGSGGNGGGGSSAKKQSRSINPSSKGSFATSIDNVMSQYESSNIPITESYTPKFMTDNFSVDEDLKESMFPEIEEETKPKTMRGSKSFYSNPRKRSDTSDRPVVGNENSEAIKDLNRNGMKIGEDGDENSDATDKKAEESSDKIPGLPEGMTIDQYTADITNNEFGMSPAEFSFNATPEQYQQMMQDEILRSVYEPIVDVDDLEAVTNWVNESRRNNVLSDMISYEGNDGESIGGYDVSSIFGDISNAAYYDSLATWLAQNQYGMPDTTGNSSRLLEGTINADDEEAMKNAWMAQMFANALYNDRFDKDSLSVDDVNAYTMAEGLEYADPSMAGQDDYQLYQGELYDPAFFDPEYALSSYDQGWGFSGVRNLRDLVGQKTGMPSRGRSSE